MSGLIEAREGSNWSTEGEDQGIGRQVRLHAQEGQIFVGQCA